MINPNKTRLAFAASIILCAGIAGLATSASAADTAPPSAMAASAPPTGNKITHNNGPESRIRHLHDQLRITPDQEAQWMNVSQVMLGNASAIDSAIKERVAMTKGMSAVDDLRSYQAIAEAHAEGIKKLAIAFAPLYASMPEGQQKNADVVFGHRTGPAKLKTHT